MADAENFKRNIQDIISQEYKVEFLGKNFEDTVKSMTDNKSEKIYSWVMEKRIQPILVGSEKKYKEWPISELLTFRHQFSIGTTEYRILFVKVKNSIYIEFHLGDHKYYDKVRKDLELKKSSY
jgi:hypothetical protein